VFASPLLGPSPPNAFGGFIVRTLGPDIGGAKPADELLTNANSNLVGRATEAETREEGVDLGLVLDCVVFEVDPDRIHIEEDLRDFIVERPELVSDACALGEFPVTFLHRRFSMRAVEVGAE
jgi:hypothetical protein